MSIFAEIVIFSFVYPFYPSLSDCRKWYLECSVLLRLSKGESVGNGQHSTSRYEPINKYNGKQHKQAPQKKHQYFLTKKYLARSPLEYI